MARGGRADAHKTTRVAAITAAGLDALNTKLTDKQREALELLAGTPTGIATPALAARGIAADAISRLARHGYISLRQDRVERTPWTSDDNRMFNRSTSAASQVLTRSTSDAHPMRVGSTPDGDRQLTGEQTAALDRLRKLADAGDFRV